MLRAVLGFIVAAVLWMAALNVVCWVLAEVLAGWVAVAIGRRRGPAWALAAVLGALRLYLEWPTFPWWYNVAIVALAAPAVLLGAKMAAVFVCRATATVAA